MGEQSWGAVSRDTAILPGNEHREAKRNKVPQYSMSNHRFMFGMYFSRFSLCLGMFIYSFFTKHSTVPVVSYTLAYSFMGFLRLAFWVSNWMQPHLCGSLLPAALRLHMAWVNLIQSSAPLLLEKPHDIPTSRTRKLGMCMCYLGEGWVCVTFCGTSGQCSTMLT